jgi:ABC-type polysaccharide/polyol phosphate export permease
MMAVISLAFSTVFKQTIPNFPIYLLIGLVLWQWLTSAISAGTGSFVANADLIKRTVFARRALPIASVLSYGINFCVETAIVLAFIPIFPHAFKLSPALLLLPVFLLLFFALLTGVVLATSVLNVIYRDVSYLVNTGLSLMFWATPVMYSTDNIPLPYRNLILWNPAGAIMQGVRGAVMNGAAPTAMGWAQMLAPTALTFAVGWLLFRRHERMALDYV